ncbi:MAG: 8-oxo-dGTP diphosphatase MutT, partial [Clostridiales bacterium]|nr:8-oxo-dGTP diphosphatase MutT [Clostridiales bacterium]
VRELKEELNIDVFIDKFCTEVNYNYPNKNIKLIAYYCRIIGGTIRLTVHDNYKWVKISDLLIYDLLPPDIIIAKKIIEDNDK